MRVNREKRKKKQGPVPTLEETLPKKFKSSRHVKTEKHENSAKANGAKKSNPSAVNVESILPPEKPEKEVEESTKDFGATKASLFDDDDAEEEADEFEGLDDQVEM